MFVKWMNEMDFNRPHTWQVPFGSPCAASPSCVTAAQPALSVRCGPCGCENCTPQTHGQTAAGSAALPCMKYKMV